MNAVLPGTGLLSVEAASATVPAGVEPLPERERPTPRALEVADSGTAVELRWLDHG